MCSAPDPAPEQSAEPHRDWRPLDAEDHRAQLEGLAALLSPGSRVVDLGAGSGRIALPLAERGHDVLAIDRDRHSIDALQRAGAQAVCLDFLNAPAMRGLATEPFDAALCLGHTLMQVVEPESALELLDSLERMLRPAGRLFVDDFPTSIWEEIASGNWQRGLSEDGSMQLVWRPGENVLAFRTGDEIDESSWTVREADRALRLWSLGEIELLARARGWDAPRRLPHAHLIVLTRPG